MSKLRRPIPRPRPDGVFIRLAPRETLVCPVLVVGETAAAYGAALAALRAGASRVCLVQPHAILGGIPLAGTPSQKLAQPNWPVGQSQLYHQWKSAAERADLASLLAPALERGQLLVIANSDPRMVLDARQKERHWLNQVVFCDRIRRCRFTVHAQVTLDATPQGTLLRQGGLPDVRPQARLTRSDIQRHQWPRRRARSFCHADSIGLGTGIGDQDLPFTLPLGLLLPDHLAGFLWASGAGIDPELRSQPGVAWALAEASGQLVGHCLQTRQSPQAVSQEIALHRFQRQLVDWGAPLFWFDDVPGSDPDFAPIQLMAVLDILRTRCDRDLHFRPEEPVSRAVLASALAALLNIRPTLPKRPSFKDLAPQHWAYGPIEGLVAQGWLAELTPQRFVPSRVVLRSQLHAILRPLTQALDLTLDLPNDDSLLRRRHLARALSPIYFARHEVRNGLAVTPPRGKSSV